jgi:hypothetical protein
LTSLLRQRIVFYLRDDLWPDWMRCADRLDVISRKTIACNQNLMVKTPSGTPTRGTRTRSASVEEAAIPNRDADQRVIGFQRLAVTERNKQTLRIVLRGMELHRHPRMRWWKRLLDTYRQGVYRSELYRNLVR